MADTTPLLYSCEEYQYVDIDPAALLDEKHDLVLNSGVDGKDAFSVYFVKGKLRLQASSLVGIVPINDRVMLRIRPRVPISNLTRMVHDTGHPTIALDSFREYRGHGSATDWAMDLYASALLRNVETIVQNGLHRSYVRREGEGSYPRGSVDLRRTVTRFVGRGNPHKLAFHWHERTTDTPVNRCLKAALLRIHRHLTRDTARPARGDRSKLSRLSGLMMAFSDVTVGDESALMADPMVLGLEALPEPRSYYRPALDLAVVILREQGLALDLGGEDVRLESLLIEMNQLFESFVRVALQRASRDRKWQEEVLDGNRDGYVSLYDVPQQLPKPLGYPMAAVATTARADAKPDLVFRSKDGSIPLVAEVKNTVHGRHAVLPERGEVNQAVTYAIRYGLRKTLLVHPWVKGVSGLVYIGRVNEVDVFDYRLDLSSDDLDAAIGDMADAVQSLISA